MTTFIETDIINSATPLEMRFAGVHPRLYGDAATLAAMREQCGREPWADFLRRVRVQAEGLVNWSLAPKPFTGDTRGVGCGLAHLATAYRCTGDVRYLDAAKAVMTAMAAEADWTISLPFGHWAAGMALAYDWLYDDLDTETQETARTALATQAGRVFAAWGEFRDAYPTAYAWNHSAVVLTGLLAAGCALWGDVDGPGRWLRMAAEKARLMAESLGPDGASAEGLAYGQYYNAFMLKMLVLMDDLLGVDLLTDSAFFRAYPRYLLYSMLPQAVWSPSSTFLQLGDSGGPHWYGPDAQLRLVARRFRDGHAQWLADAAARAGVNGDSDCLFNLLWHDDTVAPIPPDALPTLHHCADKDIVFMRSGWDDHAAVLAMKCGPNAGHFAARRYRQDVSGGHMHPDAGTVVLHAGGDWLLIDDGYTQKQTSYQNTVLVNGIGQYGEGATWFEDLPFRQGYPEGRILRAEMGEGISWVTADVAPPYKPEAGLRRFLRHVLYLMPDTWIIVDELEATEPSTFQLRFHTPAAFASVDGDAWAMRAASTTLRLHALGAQPCRVDIEHEALRGAHASHHPDQVLDLLTIENKVPALSAVFVTVLHAHPNDATPSLTAELQTGDTPWRLTLACTDSRRILSLHPGQADPAQPIYRVIK